MRRALVVLAALAVTACSVIGGSSGPDPLAGWGGSWLGTYYGAAGNSGSLEFDISTDTAGPPLGVARFHTGAGVERARMLDPAFTTDSMETRMMFDGMSVEIRGARLQDRAEGTYLFRASSSGSVIDSGTWEVERQIAATR